MCPCPKYQTKNPHPGVLAALAHWLFLHVASGDSQFMVRQTSSILHALVQHVTDSL